MSVRPGRCDRAASLAGRRELSEMNLDQAPRTLTLPRFRGGPLDLLRNHDHEVIIAGPADSSKTWACCVKSYLLCADPHRPRAHGAVIRKTFHSIEASVGRTFNTITEGMPIRRIGGAAYTDRWVFPNRSELICVGLDKSDKLLSSEWDFVQVCQSEQLTQSDWEMVASRCTGRGAVVQWPQLFGDCNPGGARHWIRERAKDHKLTLLTATHKDNPALFNEAGLITPTGKSRIAKLEATLTGVRRKRLLEGIWATSEGAVYDMFDSNPGGAHLRERDPKEMKRWFLAMDEGYTNPAVILVVGEDSDGRRHVFREWYECGRLQSEVVTKAHQWFFEHTCEVAAVDESAAGLIADLNAAGLRATPGKGRVLDGIGMIQNALAVRGDGLPRLTVDPSCINLCNEFESYIWRQGSGGLAKDEPAKENDHALDALRYLYVVLGEPTGAIGESDLAGFRIAKPDLPVDEEPLML